MSIVRSQKGTPEQLADIESILEKLKTAQAAGYDSISPFVIERLKPDGTPTDHDIEAVVTDTYGGYISYGFTVATECVPNALAGNFSATPYIIAWHNSSKSPAAGAYIFAALDVSMFNASNLATTKYQITGSHGGAVADGIDRLHAKVLFLSSVPGTIALAASQGTVVTV